MGYEHDAIIDNIWLPEEDLPGFRQYATEFFDECRKFQMSKLLRALALGMPGLPPDFFDAYHQDTENQLRLLHYPEAPYATFASGQKGRINAHTVCRP